MPNSGEIRSSPQPGEQARKKFLFDIRSIFKLAIPTMSMLMLASCRDIEAQNPQANIDKALPDNFTALQVDAEQPPQSQETLSSYDELLIKLAKGEPETIIVNGGEGWQSILFRFEFTNREVGLKLVGNVKRATVPTEAAQLNLRRVFENKNNPHLSYDQETTLGAALQNSDMPPRPGEILTLLGDPQEKMEMVDYDEVMGTQQSGAVSPPKSEQE